MAKATTGGVSDQNVDPDYVAPAGMDPQTAMDLGEPTQAADAPDTGPRKDSDAQAQEQTGAQEQRPERKGAESAQARNTDDKRESAKGTASRTTSDRKSNANTSR